MLESLLRELNNLYYIDASDSSLLTRVGSARNFLSLVHASSLLISNWRFNLSLMCMRCVRISTAHILFLPPSLWNARIFDNLIYVLMYFLNICFVVSKYMKYIGNSLNNIWSVILIFHLISNRLIVNIRGSLVAGI